MNIKRIWYIIPTAILPYLALCILALIFFSTRNPIFEFIMQEVFNNNFFILLAVFLVCCLLCLTLSLICFIISIAKKWDALSLAKTAMILKLTQIPAYVLIFVLGVALLITVFTFPFSIGLFLFDCLTLFLSGLLTVSAVINSVKLNIFKHKEVIWVVILQFIFCADVVASIIFYSKLKKRGNS